MAYSARMNTRCGGWEAAADAPLAATAAAAIRTCKSGRVVFARIRRPRARGRPASGAGRAKWAGASGGRKWHWPAGRA
jgi:hypothetical protein